MSICTTKLTNQWKKVGKGHFILKGCINNCKLRETVPQANDVYMIGLSLLRKSSDGQHCQW